MSSTVPRSKDLYEVLGLGKDATESEVQRAYRKLALKFHPDRNPDDEAAASKFKEASEAYEILKDPEKRRAYDSAGMEGVHGTGFHGFADNDEINAHFGDLFSQLFGRRTRTRPRQPDRGANLRFVLNLDFKTAALGGKTDIEVPIPVSCQKCGGRGVIGASATTACATCQGTGQIARQAAEQGGYFTVTSPCPDCAGTGQTGGAFCDACSGEGRTMQSERIAVTIPSGIGSGKVLRLKGQGAAGAYGGPKGDLLIEVRVNPHATFKQDGNHIRSDIRVPLLTALTGGKVDVPTIRGTVTMTIPAGTSSDKTMRIKGQGVKTTSATGDHLARVIVDLPKKDFTDTEKDELKKLLE